MFEPNDHSKWQVQWKAVSPECFNEVCGLLQEYYSISSVTRVDQVDEWEQWSNNYRVQCEIDRQPQAVHVRRNILSSVQRLRASIAAILQLHRCGVPTPAMMRAIGGAYLVEYLGRYWQMFEFVPGDHFRGEEDELRQAAILIAEMHKAFKVMPLGLLMDAHIDAAIGSLDPEYWDTISMEGANPFEELVHERQAFLREEAHLASHALAGVVSCDVVHADLHPQNFLFPERQRCVILDFGNLCFADHGYDIAMACHRLTRQYVVHQGRPWQETLPKSIAIFLETYAGVDRSVEQKIKLLPAFMKGLLLRKMAGNLAFYRKKLRSWESCCSQWKRFLAFLEETDAIQAILA